MESLIEISKPTGHIRATVIRANGERFIHCDKENAIEANFKNYLAAAISVNTSNALDNLFSAVATLPTNAKDGIVLLLAAYYCMKCTGTGVGSETLGWSGAAAARKLTAEFTGYAGTIAATTSVELGFNYVTATPAFTTIYAKPSSWASLTLAAADRLIIEWTITIN
uniref:Uncharacterized protein n=1 Tax=viral metagenome TaxID=1070528 RepID=A0A6M3XN84_9ZZZZ